MTEITREDNQIINPLEYRVGPPATPAHFIGDQIYYDPDATSYMDVLGNQVDRAEYLDGELQYCAAVYSSLNELNPSIREYFENSESFQRVIAGLKDGRPPSDIVNYLELFITDHGQKVTKRLEHVTQELDAYKDQFKSRVEMAVKKGQLPGSTLLNLGLLDDVHIGMFDRITSSGSDELSEMYDAGSFDADDQVVNISFFLPDDRLRNKYFHEAVHAVSGQTIIKNGPEHVVHRLGVEHLHRDWTVWLNEAITEHLGQSLQNGGFDVIYPEERIKSGLEGSKEGTYHTERKVLGFIIDEVANGDLQPLLQLYFAHRSNGNIEYQKALRGFVRRMKGLRLSKTMRSYGTFIERFNNGTIAEDPDEA